MNSGIPRLSAARDFLLARPILLLGLGSTMVLFAVLLPRFAPLWRVEGEEVRLLFRDTFNDIGQRPRPYILVSEGWSWGEHGLWLKPGRRGVLLCRLPAPAGERVQLTLYFYNRWHGVTASNSAAISLDDGHHFQKLAEDVKLRGEPIIFTGPPAGNVLLKLSARLSPKAPRPVLVVDSIEVSTVPEASAPDPPAALLLGLVGCVLAVYDLTQRLGAGRSRGMLAGCIGSVVIAVLTALFPEPLHRHAPSLLTAAALIYLAMVLLLLRRWPVLGRRFAGVMILFILAWATHLRLQALVANFGRELNPDVLSYRELAGRMRPFSWEQGFYAPTHREPIFPLLAKLFLWLFGDSADHMRYISLTFGVALVWMGYRLAGTRFIPGRGS